MRALIVITLLLLNATPKITEEFSGKVIGVTDGDTIKILVRDKQVVIRLEAIDAPESGQPFGAKAKQRISELVFGKTVSVRKTGIDRYKRTLGFVSINGLDINAKLLDDGYVWHFKKYNNDPKLADLEKQARNAKRGLWADANAEPPWVYRSKKKKMVSDRSNLDNPTASFWLNTTSGIRHNQRCSSFHMTKAGRSCGPREGIACGKCGG
jgi:endonuclease YncB( thermonuclease family)